MAWELLCHDWSVGQGAVQAAQMQQMIQRCLLASLLAVWQVLPKMLLADAAGQQPAKKPRQHLPSSYVPYCAAIPVSLALERRTCVAGGAVVQMTCWS